MSVIIQSHFTFFTFVYLADIFSKATVEKHMPCVYIAIPFIRRLHQGTRPFTDYMGGSVYGI